MEWRCEKCGGSVHAVVGEKEVKFCKGCHEELKMGTYSLQSVLEDRSKRNKKSTFKKNEI
jgi:hypothetical protein